MEWGQPYQIIIKINIKYNTLKFMKSIILGEQLLTCDGVVGA